MVLISSTLIRPHHLWILRGIRERNGAVSHIHVDSPKEWQHWRELYRWIIQNPDLQISITDSLDYICKRCPNSNGIKCTKYLRLDDVDNEAISMFGLEYKKTYFCREILRKLER